ncbi:hypothetical protein ACR79B_05120 [Sphingobacterium spiritivorum]|uniref:hypothetical protein n=1 Tax=Sphingobacterium spiritivorum TaxID=258 RepID=UPI003DA49507
MNLLKPYECPHCGVADEAKFVFSGPHIKQVCNHCDAYVKFISKSAVPDATEVRLRIWSITNQSTELIEKAKTKCGFVENLKGVERNIMHWRLYLTIRDIQAKEVAV